MQSVSSEPVSTASPPTASASKGRWASTSAVTGSDSMGVRGTGKSVGGVPEARGVKPRSTLTEEELSIFRAPTTVDRSRQPLRLESLKIFCDVFTQ